MEPKRTLHSGNLVRGFHVGDRKLFMEKYYDGIRNLFCQRRWESFYSFKGRSSQDRRWMGGRKMNQEGQEIFDLKSLTKEEVAWLEEHFIDFAREQYLVRYDRGS